MWVECEALEPAECSICEDCAKHPSLQRLIDRYPALGPVCGVCLRDPKKTEYRVADLGVAEAMSNLVRALVRYYYDEEQYNHHWGGDFTPTSILQTENPIVHHEKTSTYNRDPVGSELFFDSLFDPPYPPHDSGVSVYAGFDDGVRLLNWSLQRGTSQHFNKIGKRVRAENYFHIEPDLAELFEVIGDRIESGIAVGSRYYRARIGAEARFRSFDGGFHPKLKSKPYQGDLLGAPPPPSSKSGRVNRAGVSFLYLSSNSDTAAAEVRPHPGHELSIGEFRSVRQLRLADFAVEIDNFSASDAQLDLFSFLVAADRAMSFPVTPENTSRYSITQLIAEVCRQRGFDGVAFMSSVGDGSNICVFDPTSFRYVEGSAVVRRVTALRYDLEPVETILTPGRDDLQMT